MHPPPTLFLAVLLSGFTNAIKLPFHGTINDTLITHGLSRRASDNVTTIPISNQHNAQYITNITLEGVVVPVMLDTGSSDLWVNYVGSPPSTLKDLGVGLTLSYAVGKAVGNVHTGSLAFDGYSITDQAFLLVTNTSSFSTDIHSQGYAGLLGLGPNAASVILDKVDSNVGDTLLARLFTAKPQAENYISLLLDRYNSPSPSFTGQMTISEVVPGLEAISTMPQLPVKTLWSILDSDQHWQVLTTKDIGIKGPDGQYIVVDSIVHSAPDGQLVAVVDSGYTFSQVPREVSDAIYGRVQGAVYDEKSEIWTVPCGQYLTISFNFGGKEYPVHPLDIVNDDFSLTDTSGNHVCIGAFQPITSAFSLLGTYDMILGMSFLRNAYTLMNYGDWVEDSTNRADPFLQLLSVTSNATLAKQDFVTRRLSGVDTTSASQWALLPASQGKSSPISDDEKKKRYEGMVISRWPYILAGCLVFVLLVVGLVVWKCCCRRKPAGGAEQGTSQIGGMFTKKSRRSQSGSYLTLQHEGSRQDLPMHQTGNKYSAH